MTHASDELHPEQGALFDDSAWGATGPPSWSSSDLAAAPRRAGRERRHRPAGDDPGLDHWRLVVGPRPDVDEPWCVEYLGAHVNGEAMWLAIDPSRLDKILLFDGVAKDLFRAMLTEGFVVAGRIPGRRILIRRRRHMVACNPEGSA